MLANSCNARTAPLARTGFAVVAWLLASISSTQAQSPSPQNAAAGELLFNEAQGLKKQGRWRAACSRFESSYRVDPATGTLHNIADCHLKEGRIASAWAAYRQVADEAEHARNRERLELAQSQARELEVRLPYLVAQVPAEARHSGLVITRDGQALDPALFDTKLPVDPGPHTLRAEAPGYTAWSAQVQVAEGATVEVPVAVLQPLPGANVVQSGEVPHADEDAREAIEVDRARVASSAAPGGVTVVVNQNAPDPSGPARSPLARQVVSGTFAVLALAGAIAGGMYWKARQDRLDDARPFCNGGTSECDGEDGVALVHDAQKYERWSIASWSIAGASTLLSLAIWPWGSLRTRAALHPPAQRPVRLIAGPQSLGVRGTF